MKTDRQALGHHYRKVDSYLPDSQAQPQLLMVDLKTQQECNGYEFLIIKRENIPSQLVQAEISSINSTIFLQTVFL